MRHFNFIFKDPNGDWYISLHTTEDKTPDDISNLVQYYAEINSRNADGFTVVDVMDDLVADNEDWYWEDMSVIVFDENYSSELWGI